jgi:kumamolisin
MPHSRSRIAQACGALALALALAPSGRASAMLHDSVVAVAADAAPDRPRVVRTALADSERAAPMDIVVSLRMRSLGELQARIHAGQTVPAAEMEAAYLPLKSDYDRVAAWLTGQGLKLTLTDAHHTNLFARASVDRVASALNVSFARVATADGEFTSAVTAPSIPDEISGVVLGVTGLQPHIRMHARPQQVADATQVGGWITPSDVLGAYGAPSSYTGAGQTVAIIMDSVPPTSDLASFWSSTGSSETVSNFTLISVNGGASASTDQSEACLDAEWIGGMAPGVKIRFYAIPQLDLTSLISAYTQILNEGLASVVNYSAGGPEEGDAVQGLESASQTTAQMAAAGITVLASSGDGGSNPGITTSGYSTSNAAAVDFPASDPNVTGVGGTTLTFSSSWGYASEASWYQSGSFVGASGGGVSEVFQRPSWQAGTGVPSGTMRCVPDVAAPAKFQPDNGGLVVLNGQEVGYGGTSLSSPIWSGIAAMINQQRASAGLKGVGLLNPWIYGLLGTSAFFDVKTGSNGLYSAGTGYDLCTGVGTPDIGKLIPLVAESVTAVDAPSSPVAEGSSVTLSITAQVTPATYQWRLNGTAIPGATASSLTLSGVTASDAGAYSVVVTNSLGSITYNLGTLQVAVPTGTPTARLINLSTRAQVGTGANILIPGFVVSGAGTETLLIRAGGPSLASLFGVQGVLAQPVLRVFDNSGSVIASNTGWETNADPAQIAATAKTVGAYAYPANSADCALVVSLAAGAYTAEVSGLNGTTGVAIAELYEVSSTGTRLTNISTRAQVGSGSGILIPGFVIAGSGTEHLLVRADGPSLSQFSLTGLLAQPVLGLYDGSGTLVSGNTGWTTSSDASQISVTSDKVGAFPFLDNSADSAEVVSLTPGAYTLQVSGLGGSTGEALAELYETP